MAIRFDEANARSMGRNTRGVKGINLVGDDAVVGMVIADPDGYLLTVCENGYGKRTPFGANTAGEVAEADGEETVEAAEEPAEEVAETAEGDEAKDRGSMRYRKQRRGGKGVRDIRTTERNGLVVGIVPVRDDDEIMLITTQGMVNRTRVSEIRVVGRNTQGVRVMNLNEEDKIASIAKIAKEDVDAQAAAEETPPAAVSPPQNMEGETDTPETPEPPAE
jgi:DNA gyrase subunit A